MSEKPAWLDTAITLREQGYSYQAIGRKVGASRQMVWGQLKRFFPPTPRRTPFVPWLPPRDLSGAPLHPPAFLRAGDAEVLLGGATTRRPIRIPEAETVRVREGLWVTR